MEFGVLGPVEVRSRGRSIEIRRGIPRLLLSALVMRAGEAVSFDWLAEVVWEDDAPGNPANALQTHVSYLRRMLAQAADTDGQPIVTRSGGYVLDVAPEHIDSVRFLRSVELARRQAEVATSHALSGALDEIEKAFALWRGDPFADAGGRLFVAGEVTRLTEARLSALESRIDFLLALGRHHEAVNELRSLVAEHPLRERFHEQLMVGLYRSGRQAEALRAYERARGVLRDELGLDPSPSLRKLERLTLEQTVELDWKPPPDHVPLPTGLRSEAPVGSSDTDRIRRGRLPAAMSPLLGRDEATSQVGDILRQARLVTLTGPGGVGKTSLAGEVARREAAAYPVWFIDLDGVNYDDAVPLAVATPLGTATQPGRDPLGSIAEAFEDATCLFVIDTCEHVLAGAAKVVSGILSACAGVRILATSRRPLGVRGERVWPVVPLALPREGAGAGEACEAPSVALFARRAAAARPDFAVNDSNVADIATICVALDGLPLAIELAAAQVDTLSPRAIRERLGDRFALLVEGGRDASERQQTLRSTIEWSFNLLSVDERRLFVRLSVFAGPFGLDDAVALAGPDLPDCVRLLSGLVRQSMVSLVGEDRYQLLDTPRAYGREILETEPDAQVLRERYARLYVDVATVAAEGIWSRNQPAFVTRLREALPNLRAAIDWSFDNDQEELAARIVGALAWFYMLEGMFVEGLEYLARAKSAEGNLSTASRARIAYGFGLLAAPLGRLEEAKASCEASVLLAKTGGETRSAADALAALSVAEWALGHFESAAAHQDEAIEMYATAGSPWRQADILVLRARTSVDQGDPAARQLLEEAIALARSIGDHHAAGMASAQLSQLALSEGDYADAARLAGDALAAHEALEEPEATAGALHLLGQATRLMNDLERARAIHAQALRLAQRIGHVGAVCEGIEDFAAVAADEGDPATALCLLDVAAEERRRRQIPARPIEMKRLVDLRRRVEGQVGEGGPSPTGRRHLSVDAVVAQLSERLRLEPVRPD